MCMDNCRRRPDKAFMRHPALCLMRFAYQAYKLD